MGCASKQNAIPEVTPQMASDYGERQSTLARVRGIYMAHCAQCHERIFPGEIVPEFWRGVTPHMAIKAKLTDEEEDQLLGYLMVAYAEVHGLNPEH